MDDVAAKDLVELWTEVRGELRRSVLEATFDLWLAPLRPAALRGGVLYLTAPPATLAWVERRYASLIAAAAGRQLPGLRMVELLPAGEEPPGTESGTGGAQSLNPDHTFERFVIGPGTRLAHASALAVAEAPGEAYNPLFLYGPPGLGKTHLLGAIGNYVATSNPALGVHFTTAERFTNEFVTALRAEGLVEFKRRHRELDLLLIDDVQSLAGRVRTAEELFHTFNALHDAGSQIVLSSDRPPSELEPLAERLRDRFEWGLLAELEPPDLRTRRTILRRLVHESELDLDGFEALETIASGGGNVRQLQGALTRVAAVASLHGREIDPDLAAAALGRNRVDLERSGNPAVAIRDVVARQLDLDPAQLTGPSRTPAVVRARHIAIYLCRELTSLSLPAIGVAFNRDHSTVLHAIRKLDRDLSSNTELATAVDELRSQLSTSQQRDRADRNRCENRASLHSPSPQTDSLLNPQIDKDQQPQSLSTEDS